MKVPFLVLLLFVSGQGAIPSQIKSVKVVQFDISDVLNARPVTILNNGHLVAWTKGIDGGGKADGYLTRSAAAFNKQDNIHALPDIALFPANNSHPEIRLHYSNQDSIHYQACSMAGESSIKFSVPKANYKELYFALTSAEGASSLKIELVYSNGSEAKGILLPDYYQDIAPNDPNFCYLAHDLAKWGPANQMTEKDHHNIDMVKLLPNPKRKLISIKISKGIKGYLVFWAAAGKPM